MAIYDELNLIDVLKIEGKGFSYAKLKFKI